jgi:hypothetical protein
MVKSFEKEGFFVDLYELQFVSRPLAHTDPVDE